MSAFRHPHNTRVRPLEEELAEMGLNPDKVLSEIDRNTAMLEGGPIPLDLAGLHEGSDDVPRSLVQYGSTLLDEGCTGAFAKGGEGKKGRGRGMGAGKGNGPIGRWGDEDEEDVEEDIPLEAILFTDSEIDEIIAEAEKKPPLGSGERFAALTKELEKRGVKDPKALAAWIGRKKYGAKKMAQMAAAGRKEDVDPSTLPLIEKKWIAGAIKDPGRVREYLGVKEGEKIPVAKLNTAIEKLKAKEDKSDEEKSLLSALVLAKRLKSGVGEAISGLFTDSEIDEIIAEAEKKPPLGSGERFAALTKELEKRGVKDPKALAAWIGRKKYGAKKMAQMAAAGRKESLDEAPGDAFIEEDIISDALYLINEGWELTEVFKVIKKARGAAARIAKRMRHRAYLMQRGEKKLAAKIFRRRFKRKIKKALKRKISKYGQKGLERLHQMGRRIVQVRPGAKKEWSETLASIAEELERDTAPVTEDVDVIEEAAEPESIAVEVMVNAATTAMYLGEIFDAMGDEAGQVLLKLSEKAVDVADAIEANGGDPTEEHEKHIETVLEAVIKALGQHEEIGSPSLGEAIGIGMVAEGLGTWEELV
jgi:hypothetical protein